jgi:hypothetical protein
MHQRSAVHLWDRLKNEGCCNRNGESTTGVTLCCMSPRRKKILRKLAPKEDAHVSWFAPELLTSWKAVLPGSSGEI